MGRTEAVALAIFRWGINGFAVRGKDIHPGGRYRVGYVGRHEGEPVVHILGMGRSWEEAFTIANQHPNNEAQQQKAAALREQFNQKKAALTNAEEKQ